MLSLDSSAEILEKYPFVFSLEIQWELKENVLEITYRIFNKDTKTMYFGIGGHPGFRVPWDNDTEADDENLKATIQQIGVGYRGLFERQDDVASVAYWYQAEPHQNFQPLAKKEDRWPR